MVEPRRVVVSRHRIDSRGSGSSGAAIRVVQVTDLHLQRVTGHVRHVARAINELGPELVVFTGDMIDRADRVPELAEFLALLDGGSSKVASLGNWEHWGRIDLGELAAAYRAAGCRLLINETAVHAQGGREVLITGLDDSTGGRPDLAAALSNVSPRAGHIVLAHSPVYRDVLSDAASSGTGPAELIAALSRHSIDCVLSGHTHGGQVALFGWAPVRPRGSGPYVSGWYRERSPAMYVSRGLGTSIAPVRFGSPPEIAHFEWMLPAV